MAIVGLALLAALAVVAVLDRGGSGSGQASGARAQDPLRSPAGARDHAALPPSAEAGGAPWLEARPRRVSADRQGEVVVEGYGCDSSAAEVVITHLGSAPTAGAADRVVRRTSVPVDGDLRFALQPGLAGEPPGRYRASATCGPTLVTSGRADEGRADELVLSATFELTDPGPVPAAAESERAASPQRPR